MYDPRGRAGPRMVEEWDTVMERTPWAWAEDLAAPTATAARGLVVHRLLRVEGDGVATCDKTQFAALARLPLDAAWLGVEQDIDEEQWVFEEAMANLSRNMLRRHRGGSYAAATEALARAKTKTSRVDAAATRWMVRG